MSDDKQPIRDDVIRHYSKKDFVYECAMRALQGSFSNPSHQATIASIVRDAEKLWDELQEWEKELQARQKKNGASE